MALIDKLTAIADAVRTKTGGTDALTLEQMATEIEGMEVGGDEKYLSLINGTLSSFTAPEGLTEIKTYLFYGCTNLKTADLSNFNGTIKESGFQKSGVESVTFPIWERTGLAMIGKNAFNGCTSLTEVYIQGYNAFTTSSPSVFAGCTALKKAIMPNCTISSIALFDGCTALEVVDFYGTSLQNNAFRNCTALKILVIRQEKVATLSNVGVFVGSPFAEGGTGGAVYVPSALIESYKTATNWSTLYAAGTCNFVAIEGSEYE